MKQPAHNPNYKQPNGNPSAPYPKQQYTNSQTQNNANNNKPANPNAAYPKQQYTNNQAQYPKQPAHNPNYKPPSPSAAYPKQTYTVVHIRSNLVKLYLLFTMVKLD
ncbi:unnamed protein product, partial [Oppiella nova]